MEGKLKLRRILYVVCCAAAFATTVVVWLKVPVPSGVLPAIIWFTIAATLAESWGVGLAGENNVEVTPTSPIYWASLCIAGPLPSIIVCSVGALLADVIACACYTLARIRVGRLAKGGAPEAEDDTGKPPKAPDDWLTRTLTSLGSVWEYKVGHGLGQALFASAQYASGLVLLVGPAGLVYHYLGGRFLIDPGPGFDVIGHLILPYMGLIIVSIIMEHTLMAALMAAFDPSPGFDGVAGFLLRMKLVLIETGLPICRAELFLVIVALMMSYLYVSIGVLGIVLAAMPVVALRDFFYQWVQEQNAYLDTITTLATYMQHYHPYTRGHLKRVADMSVRLARELRLPAENIRHIGTAGLLHDIGKVGVSEEILDKPGALSNDEWERIKEHPVKGAEIISHLEFLGGIVDWIKYHHKWYNGMGYPATNGNGHVIPIEASIIAVADSFDAMTDDRELAVNWKCDSCGYEPEDGERPEVCPSCGAAKRRLYREPKSLDEAVNELRRGAGSQFHPRVVKAFLTMVERDGVHLDT